MRRAELVRIVAASIFAVTVLPGVASACSPVPPYVVFFGLKSSEPINFEQTTAKSLSERFGKVSSKCVSFSIVAYSDPEEARTSDQRLIGLGFVADTIKVDGVSGREAMVRAEPGTSNPQNRLAYITANQAAGRMRCDPASKRTPMPAACIGEYGACYVELTDGTICNFSNVPDPNPTKYSVVRE